MEQGLKVEDALENLSKVCAVFKGSLQEHEALQASLMVLRQSLPKEKEEPPVEPLPEAAQSGKSN